jgi:RNA polymerase sigma-70 factor (ECF subfamily)
MPNVDDAEIINKAIEGDTYAFRLLVEKHQAFAYSLAYRFMSSQDDAEDITQEAFIRLWKNISRYRPEIKLTTWIYKIITNLCLDCLKSKHRMQSRYTLAVEQNYSIADPVLADQQLLNDEFKTMVLKMTKELTPKQKAVFVLRDLEELEMKDVGDILSMSPGSVKSNLYYARLKMSELIRKYYQEHKIERV